MTVAMCIGWPETVGTDKTDKQELYIVDLLPCTLNHQPERIKLYTLQL